MDIMLGHRVETNAFLVPQWGGIAIYNPPETVPQSLWHVKDMKSTMQVFVDQLRRLIGVCSIQLSSVDVNHFHSNMDHI